MMKAYKSLSVFLVYTLIGFRTFEWRSVVTSKHKFVVASIEDFR
jgi:hypothetical protein